MRESVDFDRVSGLKEWTKRFALIINKYRLLPKTGEARIIGDQLTSCYTMWESGGSNYQAACRGRSDREFYAKLCIVVEEADGIVFWLELINEAKILPERRIQTVYHEAKEIFAIMALSRKTAGKRLKK